MTEEQRLKEAYRLWWEYLRRSERYREYCEWRRMYNNDRNTPCPKKFKAIDEYTSTTEDMIYRKFNDVHKHSFDEYWDWHVENQIFLDKLAKNPKIMPEFVEDFTVAGRRYLNVGMGNLKNIHGREPSVEEYIDNFMRLITTGLLSDRLFLAVRVAGSNTEELVEKFRILLRQKRKEPKVQFWEVNFRRHRKPSGSHLRLGELISYLEVYDLKQQGLKLKEVIEIHNSKADYNDADVQRLYRMYIRKAKNIIKNVEDGIFPGKY